MPKTKQDLVRLFQDRINKGVEFLDKEIGRKKWLARIDMDTFDIQNTDVCICGQAFEDKMGGFLKGKKGEDDREIYSGFHYAEMKLKDKEELYGFSIEPAISQKFNYTYDLLQSLWVIKLYKLGKK